jgi:hypothetical protein
VFWGAAAHRLIIRAELDLIIEFINQAAVSPPADGRSVFWSVREGCDLNLTMIKIEFNDVT